MAISPSGSSNSNVSNLASGRQPQLRTNADRTRKLEQLNIGPNRTKSSSGFKEGFGDSFTNGDTWSDQFADGGSFPSNWSNHNYTLRHPIVHELLNKNQPDGKN